MKQMTSKLFSSYAYCISFLKACSYSYFSLDIFFYIYVCPTDMTISFIKSCQKELCHSVFTQGIATSMIAEMSRRQILGHNCETKVIIVFLLLSTVTSTNGFETGLKQWKHCKRKTQVWELSRLWPETSTKLYVHEFGFSKSFGDPFRIQLESS